MSQKYVAFGQEYCNKVSALPTMITMCCSHDDTMSFPHLAAPNTADIETEFKKYNIVKFF